MEGDSTVRKAKERSANMLPAGIVARTLGSVPPVRHLGWGLLVAWGTISTFTDALTAPGQVPQFDTYWVWNMAATTVSLVAGGLFWHRIDRSLFHGRTMAVACFLIVASTLGMMAAGMPSVGALGALLGSLSGIGMGLGCLCWGCYYSALDAQDIERYTLFSSLLMAVCYGLSLFGGRWLSSVLLVSLPLLSLWCFASCLPRLGRGGPEAVARDDEVGVSCALAFERGLVRTGAGVFVAAFAVGVLWSIVGGGFVELGAAVFSLAFFAGVAAAVVLVLYCVTFANRLDLDALYRFLVPLLSCALFLLSFSGEWAALGGNLFVFAAQMCLDILTLIYYCELPRRLAPRAPVFVGIGRAFLEGGLFLGSVSGRAVLPLLFSGTLVLPNVLLGLGLAVTTASMFAMSHCGRTGKSEAEGGGRADCDGAPASSGDPEDLAAYRLVEVRCDEIASRFSLSQREREVLGYLARGRSTPYIRNELCISKSTANRHVEHIYAKLSIHSRNELMDLIEGVCFLENKSG